MILLIFWYSCLYLNQKTHKLLLSFFFFNNKNNFSVMIIAELLLFISIRKFLKEKLLFLEILKSKLKKIIIKSLFFFCWNKCTHIHIINNYFFRVFIYLWILYFWKYTLIHVQKQQQQRKEKNKISKFVIRLKKILCILFIVYSNTHTNKK
jgi:hypothetical protein